MVPKSQDIETLIPQPAITLSIVYYLLTVLSAIDLYHHSFFQTDKIDDVAPQRLLAAKFVSIYLPERSWRQSKRSASVGFF